MGGGFEAFPEKNTHYQWTKQALFWRINESFYYFLHIMPRMNRSFYCTYINYTINCFRKSNMYFTDCEKDHSLNIHLQLQWPKIWSYIFRWWWRNVGSERKEIYGPRARMKHKHLALWSSGIIPPPLLVSIASKSLTTSSISGRLSGFASQHLRIMLAKAVGQHLGISGRKFCSTKEKQCYGHHVCLLNQRNGTNMYETEIDFINQSHMRN